MDQVAATREELETLLASEQFRYQRIELPYGLHTKGQDRSVTAKLILPDDMTGASVLDIGCCYGYFLYEAAKRGATRLLGTEIDPDRLRQAKLLRDAQRANIALTDEDFFDICRRESFDYVLLLNVLHHLKEPVTALRLAAKAARRALILEFPTPADEKFRRNLLPGVSRLLERLPIIGVSSTAENDQTFLFTKSALERVLTDHERVASGIDFIRSPKREAHRLIAIVRTS